MIFKDNMEDRQHVSRYFLKAKSSILISILILLLLSPTISYSLNDKCTGDMIIGDVNGDNKVDQNDFTILSNALQNGTASLDKYPCGDVNLDGRIDEKDVLIIDKKPTYYLRSLLTTGSFVGIKAKCVKNTDLLRNMEVSLAEVVKNPYKYFNIVFSNSGTERITLMNGRKVFLGYISSLNGYGPNKKYYLTSKWLSKDELKLSLETEDGFVIAEYVIVPQLDKIYNFGRFYMIVNKILNDDINNPILSGSIGFPGRYVNIFPREDLNFKYNYSFFSVSSIYNITVSLFQYPKENMYNGMNNPIYVGIEYPKECLSNEGDYSKVYKISPIFTYSLLKSNIPHPEKYIKYITYTQLSRTFKDYLTESSILDRTYMTIEKGMPYTYVTRIIPKENNSIITLDEIYINSIGYRGPIYYYLEIISHKKRYFESNYPVIYRGYGLIAPYSLSNETYSYTIRPSISGGENPYLYDDYRLLIDGEISIKLMIIPIEGDMIIPVVYTDLKQQLNESYYVDIYPYPDDRYSLILNEYKYYVPTNIGLIFGVSSPNNSFIKLSESTNISLRKYFVCKDMATKKYVNRLMLLNYYPNIVNLYEVLPDIDIRFLNRSLIPSCSFNNRVYYVCSNNIVPTLEYGGGEYANVPIKSTIIDGKCKKGVFINDDIMSKNPLNYFVDFEYVKNKSGYYNIVYKDFVLYDHVEPPRDVITDRYYYMIEDDLKSMSVVRLPIDILSVNNDKEADIKNVRDVISFIVDSDNKQNLKEAISGMVSLLKYNDIYLILRKRESVKNRVTYDIYYFDDNLILVIKDGVTYSLNKKYVSIKERFETKEDAFKRMISYIYPKLSKKGNKELTDYYINYLCRRAVNETLVDEIDICISKFKNSIVVWSDDREEIKDDKINDTNENNVDQSLPNWKKVIILTKLKSLSVKMDAIKDAVKEIRDTYKELNDKRKYEFFNKVYVDLDDTVKDVYGLIYKINESNVSRDELRKSIKSLIDSLIR